MILDVSKNEHETWIKFKAKDVKTDEDKKQLRSICCDLAGGYCFEAGSLYTEDFNGFLNVLEPRKNYIIIVGLNGESPIVQWGILKNKRKK